MAAHQASQAATQRRQLAGAGLHPRHRARAKPATFIRRASTGTANHRRSHPLLCAATRHESGMATQHLTAQSRGNIWLRHTNHRVDHPRGRGAPESVRSQKAIRFRERQIGRPQAVRPHILPEPQTQTSKALTDEWRRADSAGTSIAGSRNYAVANRKFHGRKIGQALVALKCPFIDEPARSKGVLRRQGEKF